MTIYFVGVAIPESVLEESFIKYYSGIPQVRPQQNYDFNLLNGLSKQSKIKALSIPPVASFPKSKSFVYSHKKSKVNDNLQINYISLLNLPIIKNICIFLAVFLFSFKIILDKEKKSEKVILTGYISFLTSFPLLIVCKLTKIKLITMVPDMPAFALNYATNKKELWVVSVIKKIIIKSSIWISNQYDGYIYFTKYMNEMLNNKGRNWLVVEGMINREYFSNDSNQYDEKIKYIMYAGTLHEKFGIASLVEAFTKLENKNVELWIFGQGDYLNKIKNISENHSKIKYKGLKNKSEIFEISKSALFLINPRPSSEEFTKFSFPSKTLEYLASGRPLLTTNLIGIPNEYREYIYIFSDESTNMMAKKIDELIKLDEKVLSLKGISAKKFVLDKKNIEIQTKIIYDFLMINK